MRSYEYKVAALALALLAPAAPAHAQSQAGFYRLARSADGWSLQDPQGRLVLLQAGDRFPPPPGFSALGPGADPVHWHAGVPFVFVVGFSRHLQNDTGGSLVDVYDSGFDSRIQQLAQSAAAPLREARDLVGYLPDNAPAWAARGQAAALLTGYLALPDGAGGRQRAVDFLRLRYGNDIARFNQAWNLKVRDFDLIRWRTPPAAAAVAADAAPFFLDVLTRYIHVCAAALRAADPNHLVFGPSLDLAAGDPRSAALAEVDVIAVTGSAAAGLRPVLLQLPGCGAADAAQAHAAVMLPNVVGYSASGCGASPDPAWLALADASVRH